MKAVLSALLLSVAAIAGAEELSLAPRALRAGFACVDVTPTKPTPLGGYSARAGRPSKGTHDPVCARAMVLSDGNRTYAWVALDMIGIDRRCRQAVLEQLNGKIDLRPQDLLLCATHTHSGPGGLARDVHWWIAMGVYDAGLFRRTVELTAQAVLDAAARLAPAHVGVHVAPLEGLNSNRRLDGAPLDLDFALLRVDHADGRPMGVVVNYAAHPTILGAENMQFSAEFPGAMCRELERRRGANFTALYLNGDEGDMGPNPPPAQDDFAQVEAMGKALANEVDRRWDSIPMHPRALVRAGATRMKLPPPKVPLLFPTEVVIQYWQVQDLVALAVPGEMCADVGAGLKAAVAGKGQARTVIVGLANDHLGYFASPDGLKRGGYEADMSFYGPKMGETFERAFERLVTFVDPWGM